MYKVTKFPHGTFSWADCSTKDWAAGKAFYSALMGWDTEDLPMGEGLFYTMFKQDGANVAAINPLQPDQIEQGHPAYWTSYITVDDVDALVEKVTELGGTVIAPPFDVFDDGRMMVVQEPTGAMVSLWQPKNTIGAGLVNAPGAMLWNELMTREPEKAKDFYAGLLGWEYGQPEGQEGYWYILNNGRMNGGIMQITEEMGEMPSVWMVYYNIKDLDSAVAKVKELGGAIHVQAEAPGVGRFAMIADPQGASLYIMQAEEAEAWLEAEAEKEA